ncbi:hypothetical protein D7Z54_17545 [Salibacterium salarium]|uniref:Uncharacterized protein n=1 Tax=Salibacterium salarium TaxID=284579 RepID=A0A3R9P3F6_9BACI|nr:hypothetical protein [Salibacterium salarium]RSL32007.1 hypothetical protein D7Z54_17545 [Salibacterium salarium]
MDKYYDKVQEYLNMDTEIEFEEFRNYYQDVLSYLEKQQEEIAEDEIWKSLFVVESIMSNAENRANTAKKTAERKKYKKMSERTKLYAQFFTKKLHDMGYTQDQIEERFDKMLAEGQAESESS